MRGFHVIHVHVRGFRVANGVDAAVVLVGRAQGIGVDAVAPLWREVRQEVRERVERQRGPRWENLSHPLGVS
eukprot:4972397-Pyramimonas_sp.AAC.1